MRALLALAPAALLLAACASPARIGDPAAAQREAQLTGQPTSFSGAAPVTSPYGMTVPAGATPTPPGGIPSSALAAAGIGTAPVTTSPIGGGLPAIVPNNGTGMIAVASSNVAGDVNILRSTGLEASPSNAAPMLVGAVPVTSNPSVPQTTGGISDEQDFDAVSSRVSIESDAARRAAQAAQYAVIAPSALPPPPATTGPNIVEYALQAPNSVGQEYYSRFIFAGEGRMLRNCGRYSNPDEAQRAFLDRGGPERDPLGIDPDGDGFACAWDPAPFRAAVQH